MLYRSISVAIILLLSWFAYSSMQSSSTMSLQLSTMQALVTETAERSASAQLETSKKITEIQAYIFSQNKLGVEKKQVEGKLASQINLTRLHKTRSAVMKAELLRLAKSYKAASALLKGTKKEIWKAGDTYKNNQKTLRALMPKIDAAVNAWNKGDGSASAQSIYSALDKIILEKGK